MPTLEGAEISTVEQLRDCVCEEAILVILLLDQNPVLLLLLLLQKMILLQPPSPLIFPIDRKCNQSDEGGMKEEEKSFLQLLPKSPQCFDLLSENTLAQQTIANYPVAR